MIDSHEFSSRWFGSPVGIVRGPEFFSQAAAERRKALSAYSWVEYRAAAVDAAVQAALQQDGFAQCNVQIHFRIRLEEAAPSPSLDALSVVHADERPFRIAPGAMADFTHERFGFVPGVTPQMIQERYEVLAAGLLKDSPRYCLEISSASGVEGWFLSTKDARRPGLSLTLAVLRRGSQLSGMLLYKKALSVYRSLGETLGWASFSASNTAVLNIYSELDTRFTES